MIKVSRQPGQWAEPPAQELGKSLLEQKEKPRRWTPGITRIHRLHWIHRIHPVCWWCYVMLCDVWYVWWRRTFDIILWVRLKGQDIFSFCFYWKILKDIERFHWFSYNESSSADWKEETTSRRDNPERNQSSLILQKYNPAWVWMLPHNLRPRCKEQKLAGCIQHRTIEKTQKQNLTCSPLE